jgi:K+-sensing histidine kinase KdpD
MERSQGTGIGLAIAKALVNEHGRSISACNRNSGGLVIHRTLPVAAALAVPA